MIEVHLFPCLSDNYGLLAHDPASGETAAIDTPYAAAILAAAEAKGWRISQIWNTHWHPDHAGGNAAIRAASGARITAPAEVAERFGPVDRVVTPGEHAMLGAHEAEIIDVGGHTLGHIAYHLPQAQIAFVGDALFALGCGRMFEGTPAQFWTSLQRLRALPGDTTLYCAHEYTAANAAFARHADPDNAALAAYAEEVAARRAAGQPTVPTTLAREAATNPFLRADAPALMARWGDGSGDPVQTFAALRAAKDSF